MMCEQRRTFELKLNKNLSFGLIIRVGEWKSTTCGWLLFLIVVHETSDNSSLKFTEKITEEKIEDDNE